MDKLRQWLGLFGPLCGPFWACILNFSPAFAQTATCPGLDDNAAAAEQAVCWFNNDKGGLPSCAAKGNDPHPCISQTNAWCVNASLDEDLVTTACMMAAIRVGQLADAKDVAKYLRSPSQTAATCAAALKRASIKVLTNPAGAEVMIDDRSYGKAPLDVTLVGPWWESRIKAKFAASADAAQVEVEVPVSELVNALDKRECVFGDLVVTSPHKPKPILSERTTPPSSQIPPPAQLKAKNDAQLITQTITKPDSPSLIPQSIGGRSKAILWTSIALAGVGVVSSATAIGLFMDGKADINYLEKKCPYGCAEGTFDKGFIENKYRWGNILIIAGGVFLVGAITLFILDGGSPKEDTVSSLSVSPEGFEFRSQF
jgi:hypothetical protein